MPRENIVTSLKPGLILQNFCVVNYATFCTISGLYYKPMTIVNGDSRVINKLEASLTDDARVVIYNRHMFLVQATDPDCRKYWRNYAEASIITRTLVITNYHKAVQVKRYYEHVSISALRHLA